VQSENKGLRLKVLEVREERWAYVGGEGSPGEPPHSARAVRQHSRKGRPKICRQEM